MVKLENKKKNRNLLGGTFDPPHKGHLKFHKRQKKNLD